MDYILQRILSEIVLPPFLPFILLAFAWGIGFRFRKASLILGGGAEIGRAHV